MPFAVNLVTHDSLSPLHMETSALISYSTLSIFLSNTTGCPRVELNLQGFVETGG